jgi:hypothetical protein
MASRKCPCQGAPGRACNKGQVSRGPVDPATKAESSDSQEKDSKTPVFKIYGRSMSIILIMLRSGENLVKEYREKKEALMAKYGEFGIGKVMIDHVR